MVECSSCSKSYCNNECMKCNSCNKYFCNSCSVKCYSCNNYFCKNHKNIDQCNVCNIYLCHEHKIDLTSCSICSQLLCNTHSTICGSCKLTFCKQHINDAHTRLLNNSSDGFNEEFFCLNQKAPGNYEGPYLKNKKHGCGIFTWPTGLQTMREYSNDVLISEKDLTPQIQANLAIQEAKQKWEEEKIQLKKQFELEIEEKKKVAEQEEVLVKEKITLKLNELEIVKQELQSVELNIQQEKDKFNKEKADMLKYNQQIKSRIKLNVGGQRFETTFSTITKYSSFFQNKFSGKFDNPQDEDGSYFIERDGTYFRHILNFMLDGTLPDDLPSQTLKALLREATHYIFTDLISAINSELSKKVILLARTIVARSLFI